MVEPRWSNIAGLINTTWWWKTKVVSCLWCKLQRCCFKNLGMEANIWRYLENRQYAHNQQTLGPTNSLGFRVVKMIAAFPNWSTEPSGIKTFHYLLLSGQWFSFNSTYPICFVHQKDLYIHFHRDRQPIQITGCVAIYLFTWVTY